MFVAHSLLLDHKDNKIYLKSFHFDFGRIFIILVHRYTQRHKIRRYYDMTHTIPVSSYIVHVQIAGLSSRNTVQYHAGLGGEPCLSILAYPEKRVKHLNIVDREYDCLNVIGPSGLFALSQN